MTNLKFLKTLTAGVALTLAFYPQAWAEIRTGSDCDGKCTFYYDSETLELRIEKNKDAQGEIIIKNAYHDPSVDGQAIGDIKDLIIGEGITGITSEKETFWSGYGWHVMGMSDGKVVIPSTFTSITGFYNAKFGTAEINATNYSVGGLSFGLPNLKTLILTASDSASWSSDALNSYSNYPTDLNIQCKGDLATCEGMMLGVRANGTKSYEYYTGLNKDGNWEIWSDDGVALYADSTLQKPLGAYDFEGNQTGIYKYDAGGNLISASLNGVSLYKKTSYTPAEAAAAVKKGNNNRITFTFK